MTHDRARKAQRSSTTSRKAFRNRGQSLPPVTAPPSRLPRAALHRPARGRLSATAALPRRTLVGFSLMAAQAFFYNAIFFTYALVLTDFYHIRSDQVGWYLPSLCGRQLLRASHTRTGNSTRFGRRPMIALTYVASGLLLAVSGALFVRGTITAEGQTVAWMVIFFFASAARVRLI